MMNLTEIIEQWGVYAICAVFSLVINDWLTGEGLFFKGQDERKRLIKSKAMVSSWLFLLLMFVANFVQNHFVDRFLTTHNEFFPVDYPLFYLVVSLGAYFGYFIFYSLKMSAGKKSH
ncbi:MAG: hypothetical protein LKI94_11220 [Sporolactobacillus sp.]|jgi:predicted MFS family arabinose efflux permease|nr:hypothetical protein [Sporolactobacillus sp.]MCI1882744.1 hypothetical protein [Sporolactobacillus sp.]